MAAKMLSPEQSYAAGTLFALAVHQAQIHQCRHLGSPPNQLSGDNCGGDDGGERINDRISSSSNGSSSSDSVSDDPLLWINPNSGLLHPIFNFATITFRRSKIFTKLTLTLILPLSIVFLAHDGFSTFLSQKIIRNEDTLETEQVGTPAFTDENNKLSSELTTLWLIKLVYLTISLVFSLLSTSAIVYTIACIYTGKDITYRKVMSVVPKVWKRVMVTFLWNFGIMFAYNMVFVLLVVIITILFIDQYNQITLPGALLTIITLVLYLIGFVYMSVIWQMASVISVMEDTYGLQAMAKSQTLIKGKLGISVAVFLVFFLCLVGIEISFEKTEVTERGSIGISARIGYGALSLTALTLLFLFGYVVQTIIYFVCKSYHHQNIDKSSLADHLDAYRGEYVPLTSNTIQMEQFHV